MIFRIGTLGSTVFAIHYIQYMGKWELAQAAACLGWFSVGFWELLDSVWKCQEASVVHNQLWPGYVCFWEELYVIIQSACTCGYFLDPLVYGINTCRYFVHDIIAVLLY